MWAGERKHGRAKKTPNIVDIHIIIILIDYIKRVIIWFNQWFCL